MAYTQADIDALEARIKTFGGVQQSSFGDQSTTFDLAGAQTLLATMKRELAAASSTGHPRIRFAATRKDV